MEELGIITLDIKDIIIGRCLARSIKPEEIKTDEDFRNLYNSVSNKGMMHQPTVRLIDDNKYELIAGGRRYSAALALYKDTLDVKVVRASDLEAIEYGIEENVHRKDFDTVLRDKQIYKAWKIGEKSGVYKKIEDFAKKISIGERTLKIIISAGKMKDNNKESQFIQNASSRDLVKTKPLEKYPILREKILDVSQKKDMSNKEIGEVSKMLKVAIDSGVDEKIILKAMELDTPKSIIEVISAIQESPKDVQKRIVNKEISIEYAKEVNKLVTKEARDQVIKESKIIDKQKEITTRLFDEDKKMNIETRVKQQQDMLTKGDTKLKTNFDKQRQRRLDLQGTAVDRRAETYIARYQKLFNDVSSVFATYYPNKVEKEESKKHVIKIVKAIHELAHELLAEIGEIEDVINIKGIEVDEKVPIKRLQIVEAI